MRKIGPHSRPHVLAKLDGRRRETRLIETVRKELTAHVGGTPSATQRAIIERAAMLTLHMALMDEKLIASEAGAAGMSKEDSDKYLAWSNTIARLVKQLGPKADASDQKPTRTLADLIASGREQAA